MNLTSEQRAERQAKIERTTKAIRAAVEAAGYKTRDRGRHYAGFKVLVRDFPGVSDGALAVLGTVVMHHPGQVEVDLSGTRRTGRYSADETVARRIARKIREHEARRRREIAAAQESRDRNEHVREAFESKIAEAGLVVATDEDGEREWVHASGSHKSTKVRVGRRVVSLAHDGIVWSEGWTVDRTGDLTWSQATAILAILGS